MEVTNKARYGRLIVIDCAFSTDDYNKRTALVECDCGKRTTVRVANLKAGRTQSCGYCIPRGGTKPRKYVSRKQTKKLAPPTLKASVDGRASRAK